MDALEIRARGILDAQLRKLGLHEDAHHVGCGADLDRNDQAAINAIIAALTPPEGYVLVPVEPTLEMLREIQLVEHFTGTALRARYAAMLAARPEALPSPPEGVE